jgi:hypothetical protein
MIYFLLNWMRVDFTHQMQITKQIVNTTYDSINHPLIPQEVSPTARSKPGQTRHKRWSCITPWEPNISLASHKFPRFLYKWEVKFSPSQELNNGCYLRPADFNPHYKLSFLNNRFNVFNLRSDLLPSVFATNTLSISLLSHARNFPLLYFVDLIT